MLHVETCFITRITYFASVSQSKTAKWIKHSPYMSYDNGKKHLVYEYPTNQ